MASEDDRDDDEERNRPAVEELGGESEHSLEEAHHIERGSTRRHATGGYDRNPLTPSPDPDELGRRYLENATQAPVDRRSQDEEEEPVLLPSDER